MIVYQTTQKASGDNINPFLCILAEQNSKEKRDFTVSVVGDPRLRNRLAALVEGAGYPVQCFPSAADFLSEREPNAPGCAIVDLQAPHMDGLNLQAALASEELPLPIIFFAGINDVLASVQVMKAGAFDVLAKPVDRQSLLSAISLAAEHYAQMRQGYEARNTIRRKFATLSRREIEVLRHVIAGRLNKEIAFELGTVEKTIKVHRGRAAKKLGTRSVVEFVRLAAMADVTPYSADS